MRQQPKAKSTEEFLREEVFQQTTVHSQMGIAQTGANDKVDMTPDDAPRYQQTQFTTSNGTPFGIMELFRNDEGQIIQCDTTFGHNKKTTEYAYDNKGRLASVRTNGLLTEQYRYGSRGERLQELNGARYVYNYSSQLEQVRRHNGNTTFVYDEERKLAQKLSHAGNTTYSYNKYGFLEKVCLPDGNCITYTYDPLGRRSSKLVNSKITEKYCWKDMLRLQAACTGEDEDHVVFNYPESEKNNLQPTSLSCNGKKYSLAYNHVGTLLAIADESGRVVHIEETDSFGRRLSRHKLANVAMLSFGGGQLDEDTGLVHFLFRDYDPATGFFIQRDPLGLRGGDVDVYGYCLDDPVNMVDPLALMGVVNDLVPPDPENYDRYSVSDIEIDNQKGEFNIYHDGKLQKSYRVESGRTGVTDSSIKDRGPTPSGEYYINPKEISQVEGVPYLLRRVTGDWGHGRVPLHPSKETDTKGRDGFFIHGGVTPGSAGCQDIGSNDREFFHNAQRNGAKIRVIIK